MCVFFPWATPPWEVRNSFEWMFCLFPNIFEKKNAHGRNSKLLFQSEKSPTAIISPCPATSCFPTFVVEANDGWNKFGRTKKVTYILFNLLGGWQLVVSPEAWKTQVVWEMGFGGSIWPTGANLDLFCFYGFEGTMGWASPFCASIWGNMF